MIDGTGALAQFREAAQMHHEDWADVNTITGNIDCIANRHLPAQTVPLHLNVL